MQQTIRPAGRLAGVLSLPGDKSISHRFAMIASLAEGTSRVANFSTGADCHSTLGCVQALLGIDASRRGHDRHHPRQGICVDGSSRRGDLDAGNSGSTIPDDVGPPRRRSHSPAGFSGMSLCRGVRWLG